MYNEKDEAGINTKKSNDQKKDKKYYLDVLKTTGFKLDRDGKINKIYLKKDPWNNGKYIGVVKIAKLAQNKDKHTADLLENKFDKLPDNFFSVIHFKKDEIDENTKEALKFLLNDITDIKIYDNYEVVKNSLKRTN